MPYDVKTINGEHCVVKLSNGGQTVMECYKRLEDADAYNAALYANVEDVHKAIPQQGGCMCNVQKAADDNKKCCGMSADPVAMARYVDTTMENNAQMGGRVYIIKI